jgi:hypothetical protein
VINRGQIEQLFATYAAAIDGEAYELLDEVFAENAAWRMVSPGATDVEVHGIAAIAELLRGSRAAGQTRHAFTNLLVVRDDDRSAAVTMYMSFAVTHAGQFRVATSAVYAAEVEARDGGLRIGALTLSFDHLYSQSD